MGFLDKAKQLADQAQQKIDEAQKKFNESQQQGGGQAEGQATKYDQHGRPVEQETPAPAAEDTGLGGPHGEPGPPAEPAPAPEGGADSNPDPFKPLQ